MPSLHPLIRIRYRAAVWLALCVFVLNALVPQGFMPSAEPGAALIQLCSAAGPIWIEGPQKADHQTDAQHAEQSTLCGVGAALAALPLMGASGGITPAAATPLLRVGARAPPAHADGHFPGAPLGARAPPLSLG